MKNRKMSITMKVIVSIATMALLMLAVLCMSGCSESKGIVFKLSENENYYIVTGYEVNIKGKITIPKSYKNLPVKEIAEDAFMDCTTITGVTIPDTISTIRRRTFEGCTSLSEVTLPEGVVYIDNDAFCMCKSLKQITIPSSVWGIGDGAFSGCENLEYAYFNSEDEWNEIYSWGMSYHVDNRTISDPSKAADQLKTGLRLETDISY